MKKYLGLLLIGAAIPFASANVQAKALPPIFGDCEEYGSTQDMADKVEKISQVIADMNYVIIANGDHIAMAPGITAEDRKRNREENERMEEIIRRKKMELDHLRFCLGVK